MDLAKDKGVKDLAHSQGNGRAPTLSHTAVTRDWLKATVGGGFGLALGGLIDLPLLLADWTSLHLDIIASDRGLKRLPALLYEL